MTRRVVARTGVEGVTESCTNDGEGNRTSHTNTAGATTRWEYGYYDLPVAKIDADGSRTRYGYDKARRLTTVRNPAGFVVDVSVPWNLTGELIDNSYGWIKRFSRYPYVSPDTWPPTEVL